MYTQEHHAAGVYELVHSEHAKATFVQKASAISMSNCNSCPSAVYVILPIVYWQDSRIQAPHLPFERNFWAN